MRLFQEEGKTAKQLLRLAFLLALLSLASCADSVQATKSLCLEGTWLAEREVINDLPPRLQMKVR